MADREEQGSFATELVQCSQRAAANSKSPRPDALSFEMQPVDPRPCSYAKEGLRCAPEWSPPRVCPLNVPVAEDCATAPTGRSCHIFAAYHSPSVQRLRLDRARPLPALSG